MADVAWWAEKGKPAVIANDNAHYGIERRVYVTNDSQGSGAVLAVLILLAGSADDRQAAERLGSALDAYRAWRYAAAARALGA